MNFILKDENAVFYECGYSCDNEFLLCVDGVKYFFTDARYYFEAKSCVNAGVVVLLAQRNLINEVRAFLRKMKPSSLVFNPDELSLSEFNALSKGFKINFKPKANFSRLKRICKSEDEIKILKKASEFGAKCFDEFEHQQVYHPYLLKLRNNQFSNLYFFLLIFRNNSTNYIHFLYQDRRI